MREIYVYTVCDCGLSIILIGHFLYTLCPNAFNKSNVNGISTKHNKILHSKLCCNLLLMKIDSHLNKRLAVLLGYFNFHKMSDCLLEIYSEGEKETLSKYNRMITLYEPEPEELSTICCCLLL